MTGLDVKEPDPEAARTVAEFVRLLRQLRQRSGRTYRQLERIAAERGDVLPRSTIADVLGRGALPRAELLAAFLRAVGAEDQVPQWLRARARLAADGEQAHSPTGPGPGRPAPGTDTDRLAGLSADRHQVAVLSPTPTRRTRSLVGLVGVSLLALATLGGGWWLSHDRDGSTASRSPRSAAPSGAPPDVPSASTPQPPGLAATGGWVRLRPARTPGLCVTEGRESTGRYPAPVAVQAPCAATEPPHTYLLPLGGGLVKIQWHHPVHGKGCLTVLDAGVARDMLEPWRDCPPELLNQAFLLEVRTSPTAFGYQLRPAHSRLCLAPRAAATTAGAEVVQGTCTGGAEQVFHIDPAAPPSGGPGSG
ncbi:XRE family transcriptional regulator [Micromonospora sp. KC721]|uniref:XRE family transcriptional regulator n=1 Tax=Micromonospora sp. KC721 TaxID=2530380 RepID=UPI00104B21A2|nr:XRE family transcriptional regulator [Micromonospora sp. KC721]TDB74167.1 XRE family transcriptional regulator [Micromonospora sp. KC721]